MSATACFIRNATLNDKPAKLYRTQRPMGLTHYYLAVSDETSTTLTRCEHDGDVRYIMRDRALVPDETILCHTSDADDAMRSQGYTIHPIVRAAKATLVYQGEFGFSHTVLHVRNLEVHIAPYAQYTQAVEATFTPKGKQKARRMFQHSHPTLVVLDGWVDVQVPETFTARGEHEISRASSFAGSWETEAAAAIDVAVAGGARILADYRGHNAH